MYLLFDKKWENVVVTLELHRFHTRSTQSSVQNLLSSKVVTIFYHTLKGAIPLKCDSAFFSVYHQQLTGVQYQSVQLAIQKGF